MHDESGRPRDGSRDEGGVEFRGHLVSRWRATLAAALVTLTGVATTAAAQSSPSPIDTRPGLGAMVHAALSSDQNVIADKQTADVAVNADWPLSSGWRVRGEFGHAGWMFDGNTGLPAPLPAQRITLTRVTGSLVRSLDWLPGTYVGGGGGVYRYTSELSPMPRPTRPGLHLLVGMEIGSSRGGLAVRLEGQFQGVGDPNEPVEPGAYPVTGIPPNGTRSRVSGGQLNLVFGIGVGWRF